MQTFFWKLLLSFWFLSKEKELVTELDAIKGKRSNSTTRNKTAKNGFSLTAKIDAHVKNIENERDFFKKEVDVLNSLLRALNDSSTPAATLQLSSSKSPSRRSMTNDIARQSPKTVHCSVCQRSQHHSKSPSPSRQRKSILKSPTHNDELIMVLRERDELKSLLDKFERHMGEVGWLHLTQKRIQFCLFVFVI
jgi:hypothetical protein